MAFPPREYMDFVPIADRVMALKYDIQATGTDHIPAEGSAIIAANHLRMVDSVAIASIVAHKRQRPVIFGAKSDYFEGKGLNGKGLLGPQVKWFMETVEQVPVHRDDPRAMQKFDAAVAPKIAEGALIGVHPEGTRSRDGRLHKFRNGAARLALQYLIPIVPVALRYEDRRLRSTLYADFDEPITPDEFAGMKPHALSALLEDRIAEKSKQERSGKYAERPGK